ncbi:MAG: hypothetical protein IPO82_15135 [Betaproteobacteria bacterium]|nr:hypothetical protein [Betaproteobacteria bacterium]
MRDALADQASGLRALFGRRARTTLSVAGDGATAVTLNLAAALARIGQQVLVIDTMKGEAATALGLKARFELAHVLAGDRRLRDVLLAGPEGVALLPATRGLPSLAEGSGPWQDRVAAWLDPWGRRSTSGWSTACPRAARRPTRRCCSCWRRPPTR